ncbi:tripartite tricarboxylate transporter substrate-binding protein [Alkalilacustris brevis]|uniref:tripartite tricarboxylate transporter substrate-binding protein n=1 Tax=Alkalilacustris brevis TaxID=2026338 RepID=UPI000E0CF54C|nr:tripartite tricarboxylate transporter substrate-binding protein [Alkalilacustris brevis]
MTAIPGKGYDSLDTLVTLTQEAPGAMNFGALGATTAEAGYPDTRYVFWAGMFAPAGTPQEIIDSLNSAVLEALADDANAERLANIHVQPCR